MTKLIAVLGFGLGLPLALAALKIGKSGTFLGVPYNFESPTPERLRRALWNPDDPYLLTPHVFGWGYSLNLHAVARQLGLL